MAERRAQTKLIGSASDEFLNVSNEYFAALKLNLNCQGD